jgi:hypothetical protein
MFPESSDQISIESPRSILLAEFLNSHKGFSNI